MNEDKAARFHRLQRRCFWLSLATQAGTMLVLVPGGLALGIRELAVSATHAQPSAPSTVAVFTVLLLVLLELLGLPQRFYQTFILERRYGLSSVPLRVWMADHIKGLAVTVVLVLAAAEFVYFALARWPRMVVGRDGCCWRAVRSSGSLA